MVLWILLLIPCALSVSIGGTWLARHLGRRLNALDGAGVAGQVKAPARRVPNTGGIGIMLGFVVPLALVLAGVGGAASNSLGFELPQSLHMHLSGLTHKAGDAWIMLAGLLVVHVLGLVDDRKPLGPFLKLGIMAGVAGLVLWKTDTRLFTMVDGLVGAEGSGWASLVLTMLWVLVVTNAMNFMDNMDGLSAGVGAIACGSFLALSLVQQQWFVAGCFALLLGSLLGFLIFNSAPASIFMGDGGSLVLGFLLAFLSVRITYATTIADGLSVDVLAPAPPSDPRQFMHNNVAPTHTLWHATLAPLVVLAVPLYDLVSVVVLRLSQGKSPFVGDLQHLSHRFVARGLSRSVAVAVIWGFAGVTGLAGVLLVRTDTTGAILIGTQVVLLLLVLAMIEFARVRPSPGGAS